MVAKTNIESQEELEAPAKVYQFRELSDKSDRIEAAVKELSTKLELQASTQVSVKYFEDRLLATTTSFTDKITNELQKRDSRIDAFENLVKVVNRNMNKFIFATIGTGLAIIASAVSVIYFTSIGR